MSAPTASRPLLGAILVVVMVTACGGTPEGTGSMSATPSRTVPAWVPPSLAVPEPVAFLVDTDAAADDLVALAFLLSAPHVEIAAITVSGTGEAHCEPGVEVVLGLLERLDAPDIPVACGRETPLEGDQAFPSDWRTAVDAGSGLSLPDTDRVPFAGTALDLLEQTLTSTDGLAILSLGPVTNLGEALQADPTLADRLAGMTVMGGALYVPGNIGEAGPAENEVAEWNVYVDPRALSILVEAGVAPALVSLDGTNQVPVTDAFGDLVADVATAPGALLLADLFAANPWMTDGSYYLWDPLAAMLAAGYEVGAFDPVAITVELTDGPEWGFTRPGDGEPNVTYLAEADASAAEDVLLGVLNGP